MACGRRTDKLIRKLTVMTKSENRCQFFLTAGILRLLRATGKETDIGRPERNFQLVEVERRDRILNQRQRVSNCKLSAPPRRTPPSSRRPCQRSFHQDSIQKF